MMTVDKLTHVCRCNLQLSPRRRLTKHADHSIGIGIGIDSYIAIEIGISLTRPSFLAHSLAMTSPLSTPAVLQGMADALPTHQQGDDSSDLASSYEVIALLVHSYLAALSFRLCGFDQNKPIRVSFVPLPLWSLAPAPQANVRVLSNHSRMRENRTKTPCRLECRLRYPQFRLQAQAVVHAVSHPRRPHGK